MRTTVTLPDNLIKQTMKFARKSRLSDALVATLQDHFDLKKRLALLDELFDKPVSHDWRKIKRDRKRTKWSS